MTRFKAAFLGLILVASATAADVTGVWSGNVKINLPDGNTQDATVHMVLKQIDGTITGTAGPSTEEQAPISKGTIEGNKVTLEVPVPNGLFKFEVVLEGEHLKGDVTRTAQGQSMTAKMDATRAK
jgi:hypothetical protein